MLTLNQYVTSEKPTIGVYQCGVGISISLDNTRMLLMALPDCIGQVALSSPSHHLDIEQQTAYSFRQNNLARIEIWAINPNDALRLLWLLDVKVDYYIEN